jgi:hypothetical protein
MSTILTKVLDIIRSRMSNQTAMEQVTGVEPMTAMEPMKSMEQMTGMEQHKHKSNDMTAVSGEMEMVQMQPETRQVVMNTEMKAARDTTDPMMEEPKHSATNSGMSTQGQSKDDKR